MKVSELNPQELKDSLTSNHEKRQLLTNRASAHITKKINELWKDRKLKVRFNIDNAHFDTLISDPNVIYDVEVNLNERSRGFVWFFSFYVTFAADTQDNKNIILLLDEPGLFLHAVAQRDLLEHFKNDFLNQIIYTTHSPFMIPVDNISSVRTVNISEETGTIVNNDPKGDEKTLFPLQAALGYDITQSLFIGNKNLLVEGVTDYWYLSTISNLFEEKGFSYLDKEIVITPAAGASKIVNLVTILVSQRLSVIVLLDSDTSGKQAQKEIITNKLLKEENIILIDKNHESKKYTIEDLIDEKIFDELVRNSYHKELSESERKLEPNSNIPYIVQRYDSAFKEIGIEFNKTRVARLFMTKMIDKYDKLMTDEMKIEFQNLFNRINEKFRKLNLAHREPFK